MTGSDAENVCYLRDLADANRIFDAMQSCPGGNAIVIGGGYIGMECAASLVINKINVTMVFPEAHCSKCFCSMSLYIYILNESVHGISKNVVKYNFIHFLSYLKNKKKQKIKMTEYL